MLKENDREKEGYISAMQSKSENKINIRRAELEDIDRIVEIDTLCFPYPGRKESYKREMLTNELSYIVAAEDPVARQLMGYMSIWFIGDEGHINTVAVHPKYRGRGVGTALVRSVIEYGESRGVKDFTLEVRVSNDPALKLYGNFGFKQEGYRKRYYADNGEDALIMWRRSQTQAL